MDAHIEQILEQLPSLPGIYMMKDSHGEILYVGKAKSLRNRVRSYFQNARNVAPRTRAFLGKVRDIKFLTTKTETEALILESNFIKKHKPRYNVLLKDDKHYPYLRLTTQETFPRLEVVRRVKKDGATYFGPYTMAKEVRETIRLIYKMFPLRQSADDLDGEAKRRPCLNYQMGRCLAPCAGKVTPEAYAEVVRDVMAFLKGKNSELMDGLRAKMAEASAAQRYEEAAACRDKIITVKTVLSKQKIVSTAMEDQDVIGYCKEGPWAMVQVLIIRGGKMIGEKIFKLKDPGDWEDSDVLAAFLKQYYAEESILPREILLPHDVEDRALMGEWLTERKGGKVSLETPQIGKNRQLVAMAEENARFALRNALDTVDVSTRCLEELQEALKLRSFPKAIDGFDISNLFGDHAVGSMVHFENARPKKSGYRRFRIQEVDGIDDYAMLEEVLRRRCGRMAEADAVLPNLILIDGGRGHLSTGYRVLQEFGLQDKIDLVCIAKGKFRNKLETDEVFLVGQKDPVLFRENSPPRFLLQRVRDEAHRFAIAYHRKLRGKHALASPLENVRGIGRKRRLMLLKHFGSLENIRKATVEELVSFPGITEPLAREIISHAEAGVVPASPGNLTEEENFDG
jgi:excinuclease ABC subunit C